MGNTARVAWRELDQQILQCIRDLKKHGFLEPTIRAVYYVLGGALHVIPMTKSGYKSLDAKIVEMRKAGAIPWGFFAVKRGTSDEAGISVRLPGRMQVTVPYVTPDDWTAFWVSSLKEAADRFELPRWYKQPNLVEVWVEKDGLLGATSNWLSQFDVTVRAPQGYGAWEFIHDSLRKIKAELKVQHKEEVHVLYLGDLDPSGKDIPRFMEEDALAHFESELGVTVQFREIALSPDQVRQHHLPEQPEFSEVLEKIQRDPRMGWYAKRYPRDMFVELDAFYALATEAAKKLLETEVTALFDGQVHETTRKEEAEMREAIEASIENQVTFEEG